MLTGRATPDATHALAERSAQPAAYRETADGLYAATVGLGTSRHEPTDTVDAAYRATLRRALELGCNVLDTAISYRHQRSERAIGVALTDAVQSGVISREAVIVATKGGYVPFDADEPPDADRWIHRTFIASGVAHAHEFCANYRHCIAPAFLDAMIDASRHNLGVETIDIYYLHNPETQRISLSHDTFRRRMLDAFETLEQAVESGKIASYGLATWTGFRAAPIAPDYISLAEMVGLAFEVAGDGHHLRYVQLPYNAMMPEAYAMENQQLNEEFLSAIDAAAALDLSLMVSASINQGRLAVPLVPQLAEAFPRLNTDAQRAIEFARATPGITTALMGTCEPAHLEENLTLLSQVPADAEVIRRLYSR